MCNRERRKLLSSTRAPNKRVIFKTGLNSHKIVDLQLSKAEAIAFNESVWGVIFNFGSLVVTTSGARNVYPCIGDPLSFRKAISEEIDKQHIGKRIDE